MPTQLPIRFVNAIRDARDGLAGRERTLFDIICLSASLGHQLPQDEINFLDLRGRLDPRPALRRGIRRILGANATKASDAGWEDTGQRLARRLTRTLAARDLAARDRDGKFEPLSSLLSFAPSVLALNCTPPRSGVLAEAWRVVIRVLGNLHPSRVAPLHLPFIDPQRLARLQREVRRSADPHHDASGARPGVSGRQLAVDPRLAAAVNEALDDRVEPAYIARYAYYQRPGDYFWPHTDSMLVHVNVFMCLEHVPPARGTRVSAFVGYREDGTIERFELQPGDVIAAHTQGLVHAREPLSPGERVSLLAIGFQQDSRRGDTARSKRDRERSGRAASR